MEVKKQLPIHRIDLPLHTILYIWEADRGDIILEEIVP